MLHHLAGATIQIGNLVNYNHNHGYGKIQWSESVLKANYKNSLRFDLSVVAVMRLRVNGAVVLPAKSASDVMFCLQFLVKH